VLVVAVKVPAAYFMEEEGRVWREWVRLKSTCALRLGGVTVWPLPPGVGKMVGPEWGKHVCCIGWVLCWRCCCCCCCTGWEFCCCCIIS